MVGAQATAWPGRAHGAAAQRVLHAAALLQGHGLVALEGAACRAPDTGCRQCVHQVKLGSPLIVAVRRNLGMQVDDLRAEMGIDTAPYATSTRTERLPRAIAYAPALVLPGGISMEEYHKMVFNLALVRASFARDCRLLRCPWPHFTALTKTKTCWLVLAMDPGSTIASVVRSKTTTWNRLRPHKLS